MANGTRSPPALPSGAAQQQQQHQGISVHDLARVKQQQQQQAAVAAGAHPGNGGAQTATQLQQRAAAAAQFLSAERKISSREIQAMLEKNDAALRGWNVLHTQEPPKTLVKEHKEWVRKCMTYRQQVGARLEVLASLADKQIAVEDESSDRAKKGATEKRATPPVVTQTAAKKSKASAALARQAAQNKLKQQAAVSASASASTSASASAPAPRATATAATAIDNSNVQLATPAAPIPSPISFPEPPMPMVGPVNPQQFGYPTASGSGAFYGSNQSGAMASTGFSDTSLGSNATLSSAQAFPMSGTQSFATNSYMNTGDPAAFLNQQNYMMNPAAAMSMAMMNPQYLAMQMQMQSQMPMNMGAAGMYNSNAMFNNNYGAMNSNQLPADPFNTSFNQPVFPGQPQFNPVTGGFDAMAGMQSAAMMNQMNTFPMMPEQMMMNAFPYGMSMPQQQQQQQQQVPQHPQQQQLQPQQQQQAQNANMQFQNPGTGAAQTLGVPQPQQQQQQDPQANPFPESSLFDDAIASNLFDGFPEDAFLLEM